MNANPDMRNLEENHKVWAYAKKWILTVCDKFEKG